MNEPVLVIGAGRIGLALHERASTQFGLIDRTHGWERVSEGGREALLVAVRNDDLAAVVARIPSSRRGDLVFVQNGMLRPWLIERGLDHATRGLLFMAVAKRGDPIQPGGVSPFCGPRAADVVAAFAAAELPAEVVPPEAFAAIELEKLIWNCAFGLLCEAHACSVGEVVERHADELRALVAELLAIGQPSFSISLELEPLLARLSTYSRSIPDYRGAVKEWHWRNGYFVLAAAERGIATPVHDRLLAAVGRR